jgi:hypothetical protein
VLEFGFQLDSFVYTYIIDHMCAQFKLVQNLTCAESSGIYGNSYVRQGLSVLCLSVRYHLCHPNCEHNPRNVCVCVCVYIKHTKQCVQNIKK